MKSPMKWNADTAQVLTFHKNVLGILGLWVLDEKNLFSRIRWFISTVIEVNNTFEYYLNRGKRPVAGTRCAAHQFPTLWHSRI